MSNQPPKLVALDPDDYSAKYAGHTADGRQFFLTNPFVPALGGPGREFLALYLFDASGNLLEALIDDLGTRATLDGRVRERLASERLAELGPTRRKRLHIVPFALERFGTEFGFVLQPPEEDEDVWSVEVHPGNYMAFYEPFDTGDYDT